MPVRRLSGLLVVIVVAIAGCSDDDSSDSSSIPGLPEDAAVAIDEYYETVTVDHDGNRMLELVTSDFVFMTGGSTIDRRAWASELETFYGDLDVVRVGEATVVDGDEAGYVVSQPEQITSATTTDNSSSVLRVVEIGDLWLIDLHEYFAP